MSTMNEITANIVQVDGKTSPRLVFAADTPPPPHVLAVRLLADVEQKRCDRLFVWAPHETFGRWWVEKGRESEVISWQSLMALQLTWAFDATAELEDANAKPWQLVGFRLGQPGVAQINGEVIRMYFASPINAGKAAALSKFVGDFIQGTKADSAADGKTTTPGEAEHVLEPIEPRHELQVADGGMDSRLLFPRGTAEPGEHVNAVRFVHQVDNAHDTLFVRDGDRGWMAFSTSLEDRRWLDWDVLSARGALVDASAENPATYDVNEEETKRPDLWWRVVRDVRSNRVVMQAPLYGHANAALVRELTEAACPFGIAWHRARGAR